ncbi:hypothetical protein Nepgr_011778 [Nepenthes gracilis]|uniref:AN1-type domain-containing protein n=1 Tax=Nepenthes gracilis TaxID=150966 RepID=A0AAD3SEZ2_NEPGR|nr:hypothetical protein Nepgr_011778 [Nepenthes gracilis]
MLLSDRFLHLLQKKNFDFFYTDLSLLIRFSCDKEGENNEDRSPALNLSLKCYPELHLDEEQDALAKAVSGNKSSTNSSSSSKSTTSSVDQASKSPESIDDVAVTVIDPLAQPASTAARPNRCQTCQKRVGLMGFKCRCGSLFCGSHRYPEEHGCRFDYKKAGKDEIAKANPLIKPEKLQKI